MEMLQILYLLFVRVWYRKISNAVILKSQINDFSDMA